MQTDPPPPSLSEPAQTLPAPPGSFHMLCPREDQATEYALCGQWQGPPGTPQGHDCGGVWVPLTEPGGVPNRLALHNVDELFKETPLCLSKEQKGAEMEELCLLELRRKAPPPVYTGLLDLPSQRLLWGGGLGKPCRGCLGSLEIAFMNCLKLCAKAGVYMYLFLRPSVAFLYSQKWSVTCCPSLKISIYFIRLKLAIWLSLPQARLGKPHFSSCLVVTYWPWSGAL